MFCGFRAVEGVSGEEHCLLPNNRVCKTGVETAVHALEGPA